LRPEQIGVELTEGMMMEPRRASAPWCSTIPDCAFFTAGEAVEIGAA